MVMEKVERNQDVYSLISFVFEISSADATLCINIFSISQIEFEILFPYFEMFCFTFQEQFKVVFCLYGLEKLFTIWELKGFHCIINNVPVIAQ